MKNILAFFIIGLALIFSESATSNAAEVIGEDKAIIDADALLPGMTEKDMGGFDSQNDVGTIQETDETITLDEAADQLQGIRTVCKSGKLWLCVYNKSIETGGGVSLQLHLAPFCTKEEAVKSGYSCTRVY